MNDIEPVTIHLGHGFRLTIPAGLDADSIQSVQLQYRIDAKRDMALCESESVLRYKKGTVLNGVPHDAA